MKKNKKKIRKVEQVPKTIRRRQSEHTRSQVENNH